MLVFLQSAHGFSFLTHICWLMHPQARFGKSVKKSKSARSRGCASLKLRLLPSEPTPPALVKMQAAKPVHIARAWFLLALAFAFGNASAATSAAPDAGEATVSSPNSLPLEILQAAAQGDMQKVLEWLDKGGSVDAVYSYSYSAPTRNGWPEEVDKAIGLSGANLSYGDFALDLDLDEDNLNLNENEDEDEDEDEDDITQDDLDAIHVAAMDRIKLRGAA